jgi:hypothetical protein
MKYIGITIIKVVNAVRIKLTDKKINVIAII